MRTHTHTQHIQAGTHVGALRVSGTGLIRLHLLHPTHPQAAMPTLSLEAHLIAEDQRSLTKDGEMGEHKRGTSRHWCIWNCPFNLSSPAPTSGPVLEELTAQW